MDAGQEGEDRVQKSNQKSHEAINIPHTGKNEVSQLSEHRGQKQHQLHYEVINIIQKKGPVSNMRTETRKQNKLNHEVSSGMSVG
jgi:hypothetical protein